MKTLILLFHPDLAQSRVNKALIKAIRDVNDPNVTIRDEYAVYPNGNIDVQKEQQLAEQHDRIVFQFPIYWYSSPSLMKKWEDLVLLHGWAYGSAGTVLHGKQLSLAVSTGAPAENYHIYGAFGHTIDEMLSPFKATSNLIGTHFTKPFVTQGVMQSLDDQQLATRSAEYAKYIIEGVD